MRFPILTTLLIGAAPAFMAGAATNPAASLNRPTALAYERVSVDSNSLVRLYNFTDARKGFVLYSGDLLVGYSPEGTFDVNTAPPALVAMLEAMSGDTDETANGKWNPVAPLQNLKGYVMWNQDSPFNDLCPEYQIGKKSPSGCVATAMAQVMYYHQWPAKGMGTHTYSPAILYGNTLTADFGNTEYDWDAMVSHYGTGRPGADDERSRAAVAELMLHCGVAVEMVYYTQSGATDYDVPPALVNYFGYDRSLAYRKREHYQTGEWLRIIHDELSEGRPILAYGKSGSGGHAFVFDGMDADGFIHVNWGWGGMSNGYFNTSVLTPPMQGIGGADGGFNYSQRIITGIRPAGEEAGDYHVELTSTEALSAGRKKIQQGGEVKIKLSGKVYNHGWRDSDFDYALILTDSDGKVVRTFAGPEGKSLAMNANDYAPDFGNITFDRLDAGEYTLAPAVRSCGGTGVWIPIRDAYIGYPNTLKVTATEEDITFTSANYFDLKTTSLEVPEQIWAGLPALIQTEVVNEGDTEYHGEIRAVLFNGNNVAASTSNYLIDVAPGESASICFTDAFNIAAGNYTLSLMNDDGQKISTPVTVEVKEVTKLGNVVSAAPVLVVESEPGEVVVKAVVKADAMFQGLLYAFLFDAKGNLELGCLYPEYISLTENGEQEVILKGEFENGVSGNQYGIQLAVYAQNSYTFLKDDNSSAVFTLGGGLSVESVKAGEGEEYRYFDFNGFEVNPKDTKLVKRVRVRK